MSEFETVTLTRAQFGVLAMRQSEAMTAQMEAETPRASKLAEQIEALTAEARDKNITLDDASIARNPEAADLRRRMDQVVPEFQELAAQQQARVDRSRDIRAILESAAHTENVTLSIPAALSLLGVEPHQLLNT